MATLGEMTWFPKMLEIIRLKSSYVATSDVFKTSVKKIKYTSSVECCKVLAKNIQTNCTYTTRFPECE